MKAIPVILIFLRLFLGGFMVYGGIQKFQKPSPSPTALVQKATKLAEAGAEDTLRIVLYINGAKQTGYFWEVLGICEILFGVLLLIQYTGFIGALFLLPISLHIFLFHVFLEPGDYQELALTGALFATNVALVLREKEKWINWLWIKPV